MPPSRWIPGLGGSGWANWLWSVGDADLKVAASYVGPEVLAGFMNCVRALLADGTATYVTFFDEPGGTRVFLNRGGGKVFVQIVGFGNLTEPASWWLDAELIWAGRVRAADFTAAFMAMVEDLLAEHGTAGYRKRWGYAFPAAQWEALREAHRA